MSNTPQPEIRTRFRLDGLRAAMTNLREFGTRVKAALAPVIAKAKEAAKAVASIGKKAAIGYGAGAVAGVGAIGLAVASTSELVVEQERLSRASGAATDTMVGLYSAAGAFGVAADEVAGGMSGLSDQIAAAARGEGAAETFKKLGVEVKGANGQLRDTAEVFMSLMDATKKLNRTERASIYNELVGGDAEKMAEFIDVGGSAKAREFKQLAKAYGSFATPEQITLVRAWWDAVQRLKMAFKGLALEVASRFLPVMTEYARAIADYIAVNRKAVADSMVKKWNAFMGVLQRLFQSFVSLSYAVRKTAEVVGVLAGDMAKRLGGGESVVGGLVAIWLRFLYVVVQVYAAFTGRDSLVQSPWILSMRDGVMYVVSALGMIPAALARVAAFAATLPAIFKAAVEVVRQAAADAATFVAAGAVAIFDAVSARVTAKIDEMKARVAEMIRPIREAVADAFEILSVGPAAKTESPFILQYRDDLLLLREAALKFWGAMKDAWADFKVVLDWIVWLTGPIRALLGMSPLEFALFIGLLRISGLLSLMTGAVGLLASGFMKLFAMGTAGTLGAGIQGFLTGVMGQMTKLATLIPQIAVLAAAAWAGAEAGKYVGKKVYQWTGMEAADQKREADAWASLKRTQESSYDRRVASLAHLPKPVDMDRSKWSSPWKRPDGSIDEAALWASTSAGRGAPGGGSTDSVEVNFNVGGGRAATLSGTRGAVSDLTRAFAEARNAGGLR